MGFSGVEAFLNLMPAAPVPFEIQLPAAIAAAIDNAAIDGQLNNFPNIANPAPDNIVVNDVHPQLHMLAIEWYPEKNPVPMGEFFIFILRNSLIHVLGFRLHFLSNDQKRHKNLSLGNR